MDPRFQESSPLQVRPRTSRRKILVAASSAQSAFVRGVARYAREQDWHLENDMLYTGAYPQDWTGDGIIALLGYCPPWCDQIRASRLPCVGISTTDYEPFFPRLRSDTYGAGRMVAEHFLAQGYRNFAWAPLSADSLYDSLLQGFRDRLSECNFPCEILPPSFDRVMESWHRNPRATFVSAIQRLPRSTAVFASDDCVAAEVVDACRDAGLSVPADIAVMGVGNDPLICESVPIALSSLEHDVETMAYQAANLLDSIINNQPPTVDQVEIPPKGIVTRASTNSPLRIDPRVGQAIDYIAQNFSNPLLGVDDVAKAARVSRRHLERNFRHATGLTINQHITKVRMEEASRLLSARPDAKISEIAELVGISVPGNFFRTFRRSFGISPHVFRVAQMRSASPLLVSSA